MNMKIQKHSAGRILGIAAILLVLGMLLLVPMIASGADDEAPIQMEAGASVRINDPTGLRFTASLSATEYARVIDATGEAPAYRDGYVVGMLILPKSYFDDFAAQTEKTDIIDWVNQEHAEQQINLGFNADQLVLNAETGRYEFNGAIVNIKTANLDRDFRALAYIEDGTTRTYATEQSDARNVRYVTKAAIESGKYSLAQMNTLSTAYGVSYSSVNVTLPTAVGGTTETLNIVGDSLTFADINEVLETNHGWRATAFLDGDTAVEMNSAPTLGGNYTVENIAVDVNFTYIDGTTETIEAVYGTGLKTAPKTFDETLAISCDYAGDYKDLTAEKNVAYTLASVGSQNTGSVTVNADGSLTVTAADKINMIGGYLFDMDGASLAGKGWTISLDMKAEDFGLWNQYGIIVQYEKGDYVLFGARKTDNPSQSIVSILPNSAWNGANWCSAKNGKFVSGFSTTGQLNLKLTYYNEEYYLYYNNVLFDTYKASDFNGQSTQDVTTYGAPKAFGMGYRVDDWGNNSGAQPMTYSNWSWSVEGDGTWTAPSLAGTMIWGGLTTASAALPTWTDNGDGTYTFTKPSDHVDGGLLLLSSLAGQNWTIEAEIDTANVTPWNTSGFVVKYSGGKSIVIGPSVRSNTDMTALSIVAWNNGSFSEPGITNEIYKTSLRSTYQSNATLKMRLMYEDGVYYMFLNDMLCMIKTASELGVNTYGNVTSVGFGGHYDDATQNNLPRTYSNCKAYREGDAGYVSVAGMDAMDLLVGTGTTGSTAINADGSLTYTSPINADTNVPYGVFKTKFAGIDFTDKDWTVQMDVSMDDVQKWHTYGVILQFADGTKRIIGFSFVLDDNWLYIKNLNQDGGWLMDFKAATNTTQSAYTGNVTFKVTYDVSANSYSFYLNGALCGTKTAAELSYTDFGKVVAVGIAARCDDAAPGKATFSNVTVTVSTPATQDED